MFNFFKKKPKTGTNNSPGSGGNCFSKKKSKTGTTTSGSGGNCFFKKKPKTGTTTVAQADNSPTAASSNLAGSSQGGTTALTLVETKILKQVEYYFGYYNYPQDYHLQKMADKNDGWVKLSDIVQFSRMKELTNDPQVVAEILKRKSTFIKVNEAKDSIRRNPDLPHRVYTEEMKKEEKQRYVCCRGIPRDQNAIIFLSSLIPSEKSKAVRNVQPWTQQQISRFQMVHI